MGLLSRLGGFFMRDADVEKAASTKLVGSDGVKAYGGFLQSYEQSSALLGARKWTTYTNAINYAIIATGIRYRDDLLTAATWHANPSAAGGKDADRGADILQQGLFDARMPKPWVSVVGKAAMSKILGFSLHEWCTRTRADGMVVFASLAHRPQYTVERWDKPDEQSDWTGVWQRTRSGSTYYIPRNRLFYSVDDALTDSPDGTGLLRHIVELWRRLTVFEGLEGLAYQSDLGGQPVVRAPLSELGDDANIADKTANIAAFAKNRILSPDKLMWLLLDSDTYRGADANTITQIRKWAVEILKSETANLPDINTVIGRLQLEIARVLGIEFAMMGTGNGARAVHEDKTSMFAASLQSSLTRLGAAATNDLAAPLVALNGLDPETCTPTLVADPISTDSLESVTRALVNIQLAGMQRNDPARNVLRSWMWLPPEPEPSAAELGLLPRTEAPVIDLGGNAIKPDAAATAGPDPSKGEVDVVVNDLGDTSSSAPTNAGPGKPKKRRP